MNPFEFHTGIQYTKQEGKNLKGTCPFCEKEDKFFFDPETNGWDCKNTDCHLPGETKRKGWLVDFLRQLYMEHDSLSKAGNLIAKWRGIPSSRSMEAGIKVNNWNNCVIIPTYYNGKLNNLYKVEDKDYIDEQSGERKTKLTVMCTPGMEHTLLGLTEHIHDEVWIFEGHWDWLASTAILNGREITGLGVPGAGVWKPKWTDLLAGKKVVFCYDNDQPGRNGIDVVIQKHIANHPQKPKSISVIDWHDKPDKYDVNDTYREYGRGTYSELCNRIKDANTGGMTVTAKPTIEEVKADESVDSYEKLIEVFHKAYHVTTDFEYGLILALSSLFSISMDGEQLWFKFIGPPGCGKTTIATAISASSRAVLRSTFTGLFSGWKDDSDEDASMVNTISGKLLAIKDADPLLQQKNIGQTLSEFRDLYDKNSSTQYKNRVQRDYRDIRTSILLCGTRVLRKADDTFLGERFLDYEMRISQSDEREILRRKGLRDIALWTNPDSVVTDSQVQSAVKGFVDHHLINRKVTHAPTAEMDEKCKILAKLAAQMRTSVDRDTFGKGDATFTPVIEVPGRLYGQLLKLCVCIPVVLGVCDDRVEAILFRVVSDIIDPTCKRFAICSVLLEGWYSYEQLFELIPYHKSTVEREMDSLRLLKLVDEDKHAVAKSGFKVKVFTLTDEVKRGFGVLNHHGR